MQRILRQAMAQALHRKRLKTAPMPHLTRGGSGQVNSLFTSHIYAIMHKGCVHIRLSVQLSKIETKHNTKLEVTNYN